MPADPAGAAPDRLPIPLLPLTSSTAADKNPQRGRDLGTYFPENPSGGLRPPVPAGSPCPPPDRRLSNFLWVQALKSSAKATLDAGRAAVTLDFASKVVNAGTYTTIFTATGDVTSASANLTNLEALLEGRPNYPGAGGATPGAYCTAAATTSDCFYWYVVDVGSSSPVRPARISATLGDGTTARDVNTL